jgi:hypothetical protein
VSVIYCSRPEARRPSIVDVAIIPPSFSTFGPRAQPARGACAVKETRDGTCGIPTLDAFRAAQRTLPPVRMAGRGE